MTPFRRWASVGLLLFVVSLQSLVGQSSSVTGLWLGINIPVNGLNRDLALQLEQRADGRLLGYVQGGTSGWTIVSGTKVGTNVTLTLELKTPAGTTAVQFSGTLMEAGSRGRVQDVIVGTLSDGTPVQFGRVRARLYESRFLVASLDSGGNPSSINEMAIVVDQSGKFVTGAFVARDDCGLWACDGTITSFTDNSSFARMRGLIEFRLAAAGGCTTTAQLQPIDPVQKIYQGTHTCSGASSTFIGARTTRTSDGDVAQILSGMGRLADDLESATPLAGTHPAFAADYLDAGWTLADLMASFNAEKAAYSSITATFNRFRHIHTMLDPDATPLESFDIGAVFEEARSGIPSGASTRTTYVDSIASPGHSRFRLWVNRRGWLVLGDQVPPLDFPFAYSIVTDASTGAPRLEIPAEGGGAGTYLRLGPFGAHFTPLTGHANGDGKANLAGHFVLRETDLDPVTHTFFGGPGGSLLLPRRPLYVAPIAGAILSVECIDASSTLHLGGEPQWGIEILLSTGHNLRLGHVGRIHASLQARILAASGVSTGTCSSPGGGNVLGGTTIDVVAGEPLAYPQIIATEVSPGNFRADTRAQIEFFVGPAGVGLSCYYDTMPPPTKAILQQAMDADMADPLSITYRSAQAIKWQWGAEGRLCMAPSSQPQDFSALYTNLGGWFEIDEPGGIVSNEIVAFAPIAKDTATYLSTRYTPNVDTLILRRNAFDLSASAPIGEILEQTADTFYIKWRTFPLPPGVTTLPYFQRATYVLDASGLKIHWGVPLSAPGAVLPAPAAGLPCDGVTVVCYDHTFHPGY